MKQEIKIPVNQETCDYIQRVIFERNNLSFIIARFFEKHRFDKDASVLVDDTFKKYHKDLELICYEYTVMTGYISKLVDEFLRSIGIEDSKSFQWSIDDFINDRYIVVKKLGNTE